MPVEAYADLWSYLQAGRSWTGMVKNRRKDGGFYWVLANASPMWEGGKVVGYASVRMKPPREAIEPTDEVYRRFREGRAKGLRIERGHVVRTGLPGTYDRLRHPGIGTRLTMLQLLAVVLICAVGWLGLAGMNSTNEHVTSLYREGAKAIVYLDDVARLQLQSQLALSEAIASGKVELGQAAVAQVEKNNAAIETTWKTYLAIGHDADERKIQDEYEALRGRYLAEGLKPALEALRKNDLSAAAKAYADATAPRFRDLQANLDRQLAQQDGNARQTMDEAEAGLKSARLRGLLALIGGVAVLVGLGWRMQVGIVGPIHEAVSIAKQIAAGFLANRIDNAGSDETGQLMHALHAMQKSLASMAEKIIISSESVSAEASAIGQSNEALAARTEQQAVALQETSSNMEQVSVTVK